MASKALNDLFKYMDSIADQEGAARTQLAKLNHRKQAAPAVLQDLREVQTQELMQRLGKQRKINQQMAEQQAEQGRAPEVPMDPIPVRTSTVGQALGSQVAESARSSVAETSPDSFIAGASAGQPGGDGSGIDDATSTQTITETGERPGWAQRMQRLGSPGLGLIGMGFEAAGMGGPTPIETTRTIRNTPSPASVRMAQEESAAEVFGKIVDRVPLSQAPVYKRAMTELAVNNEFSPETEAMVNDPKFKTYEQTRVDLTERGLEQDDRHQKAMEQIRWFEARKSGAASEATKAAEGTRQALLQEQYWRTVRERTASTNPPPAQFNMARERGSTADPKLESLAKDLSIANEKGADELSPAQVNNFGVRTEATNYILTREGGAGFRGTPKLGSRPVTEFLVTMAAAREPSSVGATKEQSTAAGEKLKQWHLAEDALDKNGNVVGIQAITDPEDNFSSYSGSLFEVYDQRLRGSDVWTQAVKAAGLEPKLTQQAHPGFGGGPAAAGRVGATREQHERAVDEQTQLMQILVPGIPESQVQSLPEGNPLRRRLGQ